MRTLVKVVFGLAIFNTVVALCNSFIIPDEYRMSTNLFMLAILVIQIIVSSIVLHSPNKESK